MALARSAKLFNKRTRCRNLTQTSTTVGALAANILLMRHRANSTDETDKPSIGTTPKWTVQVRRWWIRSFQRTWNHSLISRRNMAKLCRVTQRHYRCRTRRPWMFWKNLKASNRGSNWIQRISTLIRIRLRTIMTGLRPKTRISWCKVTTHRLRNSVRISRRNSSKTIGKIARRNTVR